MDFFTDKSGEHRSCQDHRRNTDDDAQYDDIAELYSQHFRYQHRSRCGRHKSMSDRQTCQQGNGIIKYGFIRLAGNSECHGDQDQQTGFKEYRHSHDQSRNA